MYGVTEIVSSVPATASIACFGRTIFGPRSLKSSRWIAVVYRYIYTYIYINLFGRADEKTNRFVAVVLIIHIKKHRINICARGFIFMNRF